MRVVTVLGPSQAGKSTLIEALAALEDPKPARLSLYGDAAVTRFNFMDEPWAMIEIAGGAHNLAHLGPALAASDAAVLVVPAEAADAVLAAPYLRLLEAAGMPTFVFVNKVDAAANRLSEVVAALQVYSPHAITLRQIPVSEGGRIVGAVDLISERTWAYHEGARSSLVELPAALRAREEEARSELLDHLADFDDHLLEQLIEDQKPMSAELYEVAARLLQHHDLVPAFMGATSHGNGVQRLMKALRHEVGSLDGLVERLGADAIAVGALADNVKHLGKTVLIRALASGVGAGQTLAGDNLGSVVDIDGKTPIGSLAAGEIGLTVKSDHLGLALPVYTAKSAGAAPAWAASRAPKFRVLAAPENERDETRLSTALTRLTEIDPGLALSQDPASGRTVLATQGPLHLRRLLDRLDEVFGVKVQTDEIPPALLETIRRGAENHHRHRKQSGGAGQFADVMIEVRPLGRGAGFVFEEIVKGGAVPRNYIPSVEAGAREALTEGPHGHPVVDIAVTLKDGKYHAVDSSDFAFRTAGKNAVREALAEAGTNVLQPIAQIRIEVPSVYAGGLVPMISGLKGQVLGFEGNPMAEGWDEFKALLPQSAEAELFQALGSATRGTAWFHSDLDHYEEARDLS